MTDLTPILPHGSTQYVIATKTRASFTAAVAALILVTVLVALPAFAGREFISEMIFVFYMLALAQCWNLLAGYAGLVSVGQQAFVGLGGYLLFALTIMGVFALVSAMTLLPKVQAKLARFVEGQGASPVRALPIGP